MRKNRGFTVILVVLLLLLLLGTAVMVLGILLPYRAAQKDLPVSGQLTMEQQTDGNWALTWPAAEGADRYVVELTDASGEVLYRNNTGGDTSLLLPAPPKDQLLTIRVIPAKDFKTLLGADVHYNETCLETSVQLSGLEPAILDFYVDGDEKTVSVKIQPPEAGEWQYQLRNSADQILSEGTSREESLLLHIGEGKIPLPAAEEEYRIRFRVSCETENLAVFGKYSNDFRITEASLQERKLNPKLTETSKNTVCITWEETKGAGYGIQQLKDDDWETVKTLSAQDPRSYIGLLEPEQSAQFRVVSMDEAGAVLQTSETLSTQGRDRVRYATVWPVRDLAAYSTGNMGHVAGYAKVGQAYCVLDEVNGMFEVQIDGELCYIDSTYCMINLPEYLGGLCSYHITNSESAIYAVHEFAIPEVTGVITAGYENVRQEDGSYLVPLLYPSARKLLKAVETARDMGYRLKIYDSFRPYIATREIYDLTEQLMDMPLPDTTYTGQPRSAMELPEPRPGQDVLTLGWLMTGYNYELNSFLARSGSAHNLGVALDLTLEDWDTGEQVQMQSSMHDLSQYSVLPENNEAADLLTQIMTGAGFGGLFSEWWHFQDNNAKNNYGITSVLQGVSAECWMKDDYGWKYRTPKGGSYAGQTVTISGTEYTFDANGYVLN